MKLLELYKSILKAAHLLADEEGLISRFKYGKKEPFFVGEERLVLNTPEQLKVAGAGTVVFHPLFEYLTRGESPVMAEYRRVVTERLHDSFLAMAYKLIEIAASQQQHALLTPEQSEFLSYLPEADGTMLENFEKLVSAMPEGQNQKAFVSMFLRRGGKLEDKTHHRVAIVTFPLYKQLVKDGEEREAEMARRKDIKKDEKKDEKKAPLPKVPNETYGVELRGKDRESFIKLFEYMLPNIAVPDAYSSASNSTIAPSMDAVMHSVEKLAGPLNDLVNRFENRLEGAAALLSVEDAWVPEFVNLAALQLEIRKTPMQAGNEGEAAKVASGKADMAAIEAEARGSTGPVPRVEIAGNPQESTPSQVGSVADDAEEAPPGFRLLPKRDEPVRHHLPVGHHPGPAPGQAPYQPPGQGGYYPPGQVPYQQPPVQQPPPVYHSPVNTGQGVDFHTLIRSNPALAATVQAQMQVRQAPHPQQQVDVPTWAQPGYGHQSQQQQDPRYGYAPPNQGGPYKPNF